MDIILHRSYLPWGVYGEMIADDRQKLCYTVERRWQYNQPRISCVPEGVYRLTRHKSPRFGNVWALEGGTVGIETGHRTHILIHAANYPWELEGCIAPCMGFAFSADTIMGTRSRAACARLYEALGDADHQLTIQGRRY